MQQCFSQKLNRAENPGTRMFGAPPYASKKKEFKGSDRLCMIVELRMQCCGKILPDSFETY